MTPSEKSHPGVYLKSARRQTSSQGGTVCLRDERPTSPTDGPTLSPSPIDPSSRGKLVTVTTESERGSWSRFGVRTGGDTITPIQVSEKPRCRDLFLKVGIRSSTVSFPSLSLTHQRVSPSCESLD